jgi:hypothetical protein
LQEEINVSVQVSYKKQFALGLFILLILLFAIEGITRIFVYFTYDCLVVLGNVYGTSDTKKQICSDSSHILYEKDTIIPQLKPNQHTQTVNINSYGFRGPEITKEKPHDVYRIFVVGGSTVFGTGSMSDNTTISGFLQKKFDDANLNKRVEVINAGISDAYSAREVYYIKNKLLEFKPDLFIIYDGWNDSFPTEGYEKNEEGLIKKENELKTFTEKYLWFYETPKLLYVFFSHAKGYVSFNDENIHKISESWKNRWTEICELGKTRDFSTIVVIHPIAGSGNKQTSSSLSEFLYMSYFKQAKAKQILNGLAESLDDLKNTCEGTADLRTIFDGISEPLYIDAGHVGDLGNEIVAQKLYEISLPTILEKIT